LLTTVDHSKGLTWSWVGLTAAGSTARISVPKADVDRLVKSIRDRLAIGQAAMTAPSASPSTADEIRQLAALRDEGLLTADEFEQKKTRLLGL
jgi:hypothetical protein